MDPYDFRACLGSSMMSTFPLWPWWPWRLSNGTTTYARSIGKNWSCWWTLWMAAPRTLRPKIRGCDRVVLGWAMGLPNRLVTVSPMVKYWISVFFPIRSPREFYGKSKSTMKCPVVLCGIFSVWGIGLIGLCLPWNIPTWVCLNRCDPLNRSISRSLQLAALVDQDRIAWVPYHSCFSMGVYLTIKSGNHW